MKRREIGISIVLSVITCGIYLIYWMIVLTDDIAEVSEDHSISGGMAFLLSMVTCGIYGIYWAYKMGQNLNTAKQIRGQQGDGDNTPIMYLLLQIFGLGIVNYALMQSELNKMNEM